MPYKDKEKQRMAQRAWATKYRAEHNDKKIAYSKHRKRKSATFLRRYKEMVGCIDCVMKYPHFVLQFDHLRDKKMNIAKMASGGYSMKAIKDEIRKCEVVCANCHSIRTYNRRIQVA